MVPLCLNEFVLLKSCQVESEQQKLQDLNQEHTQNLLVSDYAAYSRLCSVLSYHWCPLGGLSVEWSWRTQQQTGGGFLHWWDWKSLSTVLLIENTLARKNGDVSKYCWTSTYKPKKWLTLCLMHDLQYRLSTRYIIQLLGMESWDINLL